MKNSIFKSVKLSSVFGVLLFLTISANVFGQANENTNSATENNEQKKEENQIKNLQDCKGQGDDCRIAYYTQQIASAKGEKITSDGLMVANLYANRGRIYYERGEYDKALSDFNFVIKEKNYSRTVFLHRAIIHEKKGDYDLALSDYLKAGEDASAFLGIGNIALYRREFDTALVNFNKAIFLSPRTSKALFGRAVVYLEFGKNLNRSEDKDDKAKAIQYFKDALKDLDSVIEIDLNNTSAETYLKRAQVYDELGEKEKAEAERRIYKQMSEKSQ